MDPRMTHTIHWTRPATFSCKILHCVTYLEPKKPFVKQQHVHNLKLCTCCCFVKRCLGSRAVTVGMPDELSSKSFCSLASGGTYTYREKGPRL